ncbi:hypothetical protein CHS0354_037404 [Potamilus streckersoni]|uniref:Uncharacterized protein n=1 Tax=Potamilus streckersoni TaxID=2493646 RepID=A0AAE0RS04_9BIVA|nr:hypothetical protein CHS0354_037404 [Potamilus streckersoni]
MNNIRVMQIVELNDKIEDIILSETIMETTRFQLPRVQKTEELYPPPPPRPPSQLTAENMLPLSDASEVLTVKKRRIQRRW